MIVIYPYVIRFLRSVLSGPSCLFTASPVMILLLLTLLFILHSKVEAGQAAPIDLTELSLEELMNIQVTSVSKKEQKIFDAAAAIFVITQEDIRRSGVTSIPEALRMVPGLQVAKIDANKLLIIC